MTTLLWIAGLGVAAWVGWSALIVVRGNNYQAMVRQLVISELGMQAGPYLQSRPIIEQITNAYRRGDPATSTAMALTMLVRQAESKNSN